MFSTGSNRVRHQKFSILVATLQRLYSFYIILTIQVFKHHSVEPIKVAEVNHQNNEHSRTDFKL